MASDRLATYVKQRFHSGNNHPDMSLSFTDQQLQAYLDEALSVPIMAQIENALRRDATLRQRLIAVAAARESGIHGLGEIWRRHQLSCPTRQELGSFLLGAIDPDRADYVQFHLGVVHCRFCQANLDDLKEQQAKHPSFLSRRRHKFFQTSAGYLRSEGTNPST